MSKKINNKGHVVASAQQLSAGAAKHFPSGATVMAGKNSYTLDQITSNLQKLVDLRSNVDANKAALAESLSVEAVQAPALIAFHKQFKAFVKATFIDSPAALADFGIVLKPRKSPTAEEMTAAVAKRASTREARHTMGPKQKLEVKGDVTGVVVTPVKASQPTVPAPSSPTAPATSGSPTATTTQHTS
jgi:hypothetical protein